MILFRNSSDMLLPLYSSLARLCISITGTCMPHFFSNANNSHLNLLYMPKLFERVVIFLVAIWR